jgi:DNA-directed RNA polymerase subunit A'
MDAISGNYLLTKYGKFDRKGAIQILTEVGQEDFSRLPDRKEITGKELFSMVLPGDFDFVGKAKDGSPVIIQNGFIKEGIMDKANLGEGQGLMLRNLHKNYGAEESVKILGKIFRMGVKYLMKNGLTASISDADLSESDSKNIKDLLDDANESVFKLINDFNKGKLTSLPGRSVEETLELSILQKLNNVRNESGNKITENLDDNKHISVMIESGAKGSSISMTQMAACVGQQALRGSRIDRGYSGRTLSCFKKDDFGSAARGFVENSFKSGLKPHEFFFMAMTGRDSLMDTALRTPKSGYLYRRLANAMQDVKVEQDHTVRDAGNRNIQFSYGGDGIDVSKSEGGQINVKKIVDSVLEK